MAQSLSGASRPTGRPTAGRPRAKGRATVVRITDEAERALRSHWPEPAPLSFAAQWVLDQWVANRVNKIRQGGR